MLQKIFIADIGNSYCKIAIIDSNFLVIEKLCFKTQKKTENNFLKEKFLLIKKDHKVSGAIVGSVVASQTKIFLQLTKEVFKVNPYLINENTKLSYSLKTNKTNIGQDILALAEFCSQKNPNSIGFSFGTAMFGILLKNNILEGATISAGLGLSFMSLANRIEAINCENLDIKKSSFLGNDTVSAIESGINNLRTGYVLSFYENAIKLIPDKKIYCVICGGEAAPIYIKYDYEINVDAILIGYALIYFKNNENCKTCK